jgi:hypothetical protein
LALAFAAVLAGCERPAPRSFEEFMEDGYAREGVLTRCNQDRSATLSDVECANARRAAAVIALQDEKARKTVLEAQSERKLVAMRDRAAREQQAEEQAVAAEKAAEDEAYEARWRKPAQGAAGPSAETAPPQRPGLALPEPEPPASTLVSAPQKLELDRSAVLPRPFVQADAAAAQVR